ncbi:MAG: cell division protein ZapE [Parvularculaceae bacterium]
MRGPLSRYRTLVDDGALRADPAQEAAAVRLQALEEALAAPRRFSCRLFLQPPPQPKGLYLWGAVGRGKSLLMDIFFNNSRNGPKRRVHFHEFMAETHGRIAAWRAADEKTRRRHPGRNRPALDDPMPPVARDIAKEARLLCFDEFQVTDIADAMVLGRLFEALFAERVVIVATSNRHPDDLYKDGINRQLFTPFIGLLKEKLDVVELKAARDYRLEQLAGAVVYHAPLGPDADAAMDQAWRRMIAGAAERAETIEVMGREVPAPRVARDAARFTFDQLCRAALGPGDYLAVAGRYGAVFLDRIPRMGPAERNEARRFVTLIDALYEAKTKLICSADAAPFDLYPAGDGAFEFARTASRLIEMRSAKYLAAEHGAPAAPAA